METNKMNGYAEKMGSGFILTLLVGG